MALIGYCIDITTSISSFHNQKEDIIKLRRSDEITQNKVIKLYWQKYCDNSNDKNTWLDD